MAGRLSGVAVGGGGGVIGVSAIEGAGGGRIKAWSILSESESERSETTAALGSESESRYHWLGLGL